MNNFNKDYEFEKKIEKEKKFPAYLEELNDFEEIQFNSNLNNTIFLKDLVKDCFYSDFIGNNTYIIFRSINNILFLIYANKNNSIISYNLIYNIKINEIKNAHYSNITKFRYFFDKIKKRDLFISISQYDNNIKLWNINNFECLYNFKNINKNGLLLSACFLKEQNNIYIISSNFLGDNPIKVFDLNGNKIKEINYYIGKIYFINSYYDRKLSKNYIIIYNSGKSASIVYNENKIYHVYNDNNNYKSTNSCIIINSKEEIIKLIDSSYEGTIRIWNFHSGEILNRISIGNIRIFDICLWDNKYLLVGCIDKTIKILDLKKGKVTKILKDHNNSVITIKKFIHPQYGECFLSQGYDNEGIQLWAIQK